ncbi:hypothetical protein [Gimesia fumaroli]|uniref:Uncharacterized protein n=1 Tax=Gimesia fumaroli TaxID=2527976 RepID=A0A518IJD2_9PLAN|nr:hypothetical protein [Gimesia fumaroli]QDV53191.1 hypothetical protein Enr17x_52630 [Gimesia fumaroli]
MKNLMGIRYENLIAKLGVTPEKHYHSKNSKTGFSVFIKKNEFLFIDDELTSINIYNFPAASSIPGFVFPIETELEKFLGTLAVEDIEWEVYQKYSYEHWVVIKLLQHSLLYEFYFDFENKLLKLERIRLERDWIEE